MTDQPNQTDKPTQREEFEEIGSLGLEVFSGFISEAYNAELFWPQVQPLYSRIRRSDPEVSIIRINFLTLTRDLNLFWEIVPGLEDNKAEQDAKEFGDQVLADLDGGPSGFLETLVSHGPFMGWATWEMVAGVRSPDWQPPDENDPWRSKFNDNRVGFRRWAWRDSSSLFNWDIDEKTGRLMGMVQMDIPNPTVTIPIEKLIHVTFGDSNNPEGLSPLEALWRLERIKYGLEVVQGIGFEHSAGYLDVKVNKSLDDSDKQLIANAAKAILSGQQSNYALWPKGIEGEVKDTDFSAASTILDAIRYYGILKLMMFTAQWIAMSAITSVGSLASMQEVTNLYINAFNAMMEGFIEQVDRQVGHQLFDVLNPGAFPGMTERPHLKITKIDKDIDLGAMSQFIQAYAGIGDYFEDDLLAIRAKTKFMPEVLGEEAITKTTSTVAPVEAEQKRTINLASTHDPVVTDVRCPLCGNGESVTYPGHKGLHVCVKCNKTFDPEVE